MNITYSKPQTQKVQNDLLKSNTTGLLFSEFRQTKLNGRFYIQGYKLYIFISVKNKSSFQFLSKLYIFDIFYLIWLCKNTIFFFAIYRNVCLLYTSRPCYISQQHISRQTYFSHYASASSSNQFITATKDDDLLIILNRF